MTLEAIANVAKRRGFISQSSGPYGGFSSTYDYGPLGVELKNNIKRAWWRTMVYGEHPVVGLDSAIMMNPRIWEASGHLGAGFTDPLVECKACHHRFRTDQLDSDTCPDCGGEFTEERKFNLMMKTFVGAVEDTASTAYLRPETAQGIYVNFPWVQESMRKKLPFGIAQIGKAFRNEITPGNFTYRMREFEQMEMQFFVKEGEREKWFEFWKKERMAWYVSLGIPKEKLRFHQHSEDELAHYARTAVDIEYEFPEPLGWKELEGIHDRGDWDLSRHSEYSSKDLTYFDDQTREHFIPHIIETSAGADRSVLAFLSAAYDEVSGGRAESADKDETVLRFSPKLAPAKVAVLPLVKNKEPLLHKAEEVHALLRSELDSLVLFDITGSIGRRYRRQDEIGTPFCCTVDFDTLEDNNVTVRDRDTMEQERVDVSRLVQYIKERIR